MIKNKKILMVGKETYTYPFYFLAERWRENNKLAMLWTNPIESLSNPYPIEPPVRTT